MDINQFANYLLITIIVLQIVSMTLFIIFYKLLGPKTIPLVTIMMFLTTFTVLSSFQRIKVYNSKGNIINTFTDTFSDMIVTAVWTGTSSLVLLILGIIAAVSTNQNKGVAMLLPFISTITFYAALVSASKLCKHTQK